jgi:hypothetical protein
MPKFADRVKISSSTTGTGTLTLGSAISGFQSIPASLDGETVGYVIENGSTWELGTGTYTHSGTTLSRTYRSSSTGALLNLTGASTIFLTPAAADLQTVHVYAAASDLPNASSNHGKICHLHSLGRMVFAHAGNWINLANASEIVTYVDATTSAAGLMSTADKTKLDAISASANNYVHPNHTGEVTSAADGATVISDNVVDEANLKVSNSPTNGYVLTAQSGNAGGLTWAAASSGGGGGSATSALSEQEFTATANQTVFTVSGGITNAANVAVFLNGSKLGASDYTASASSNNVTLAAGATVGDLVEISEFGQEAGGASVTSSDTAPTSPSAGDLWFDSSTAELLVYYADGSSNQWVTVSGEQGPQGATGSSGTSTFAALTDTPSTLSGQGGKAVQVNSGGSALEFVDAGGAGTTVHANQTAMTNSNPDAGTLHFVTDTNSLFVKNSSGFFRLAQLTNVNPTISNLQHTTNGTTATIAASATFGLTAGQNSVITLTAADPDFGDTIFYSATVVSGTQASVAASITQGTGANVNKFTIVPASSGSGLNSITVRFDASDGIGVAQRSASFSIAFYNYSNTAQQSQLNASDGAANDFLGGASAIDGDYCVVGAYGDENYKGAAYVYVRSGTSWTQQAKLTADDGGAGHYFGYSVAISGDTIVVGAEGAVRAYVYVRSGTSWSQQQKIVATGYQNDDFGWSVGIDGDYIAVGAQTRNSKGAAFVFVRSGTSWTQQAEFTGDSTSSGDVFGYSVAISGDTVAVGAKFDDDGGTNVGQVFVFTRSGTSWSQQAKFYHSSAAAADLLGSSISIHNDTIAAGAWGEDTSGSTSGAVYVFVRNGTSWSQQAKLKASNAGASDNLGYSVSVRDDLIIAGAPYEDTTASDAGSAYIFQRSGTSWTQKKQIQATNAGSSDKFGWSVGVSEPYFVIGAYHEDTSASNAGAGYVFVAG